MKTLNMKFFGEMMPSCLEAIPLTLVYFSAFEKVRGYVNLLKLAHLTLHLKLMNEVFFLAKQIQIRLPKA